MGNIDFLKFDSFKTQSRWSSKSRVERAKMMNKIADLIEENLDELARIESRDQGKPIWLARAVDIPRAVHNFRFFASSILHTRNRLENITIKKKTLKGATQRKFTNN